MATPKVNQEKIDAEIRKNKLLRSKRHTTKTTFKTGMAKVPGCGRKKGSRTDPARITIKQYRKALEETLVYLLLSIKQSDLDAQTVKEKFNIIKDLNKFIMPELKAIETKETQITKIEVSFSDDFGEAKTIDISHQEIDNDKNSEEEDMNGENA